jgi:hypothetical protein
MHHCTTAISPGYNLMQVSATIYSTWVVAMLSSGLISFTNMSPLFTWIVAMSLYSPGWWPQAMSLFIHLDVAYVSYYSPGWWLHLFLPG